MAAAGSSYKRRDHDDMDESAEGYRTCPNARSFMPRCGSMSIRETVMVRSAAKAMVGFYAPPHRPRWRPAASLGAAALPTNCAAGARLS
jgi:hypothetical protein